jgi:hypothetical protein
LYESSGCNPDWASSIGIKHAYAIELKPKESLRNNPFLGFEYPEENLEQVGLEIFNGLVEYFKTFYFHISDKTIVNECKAYYDEMISSLNEHSSKY